MRYNIDSSRISLGEYKELLKKQNLIPSRRPLLIDIDENFSRLQGHGINTVSQLRKTLSSANKISSFSVESGIPEEYLTILRREAGTLEQKPVSIESFPGIDASLVSSLRDEGIKTSRDYFESDRALSDELFCLCDLVRINGVGAVAARAFYEAGYASVSDVAAAEAETMLKRVTEVNSIKHYYKATLGVKDMQFCIDFAAILVKFCD